MHEAVQRRLKADNLPASGRSFGGAELAGLAKFVNAPPLKSQLGTRQCKLRLKMRLAISHRFQLHASLIKRGSTFFAKRLDCSLC